MSELKPVVSKEDSLDLLDIRLGRVMKAVLAPGAKPTYKLTVDFGKFGVRTSVGRFTQHTAEDLQGLLVMGVLNFEPREVNGITSEFLCLGVQFPKAESGEATPITPFNPDAKLGSKLF